MKKSRTLLLAATLATASFPAKAGGPMPKGTFALGAERLTGIFHADLKADPYPGTVVGREDVGVTAVALFGSGAAALGDLGGIDARSIYAIPRVGFDYFVIDGLSLGGSFTVFTASFHDSLDPNGAVNGSTTDFLFAPRVGYAYMFSDVVGIWPRGGFSYTHGSVDPDFDVGSSSHFFAFDIDVPLLIAPVKSFAITVGPLLDVTIGGSLTNRARNAPDQTHDASLTLIGLSAGVVGLL